MTPPAIVCDLADLVLGRCCLGCGAPGPGLCAACVDGLRGTPLAANRTIVGPPVIAATTYSGLGRTALLAYKKQGYRSLAAPLGWLLADAIWAAMRATDAEACVIVPVPGHRRSRRGFEALGDVVREARRALAGAGVAVREARLLRVDADYAALKGLGRAARRQQVAGAFRAVQTSSTPGCVIVLDDVITTGATAAEAVAALERASIGVSAVATIAATITPDRWATSPAPAPATHLR